MRSIRTPRARERFLEVLRATYNVTAACQAAGIGRTAAYAWRKADEEFAADWADAELQAKDAIEAEVWRRAVTGVLEPVYQGGQQVGVIRRYSDRLLEVLIKARLPRVYAQAARVQIGGDPGGAPIPITLDASPIATPEGRADWLKTLHETVGESERDVGEHAGNGHAGNGHA